MCVLKIYTFFVHVRTKDFDGLTVKKIDVLFFAF